MNLLKTLDSGEKEDYLFDVREHLSTTSVEHAVLPK